MNSVDYLRRFAESCVSVAGVKAGLTREAKPLREIADELETLRKRDHVLAALEDRGVAHWDRYEDSLEDVK